MKAKAKTEASKKEQALALVDGVKAIVRKHGPISIGPNEVVYKTEKAYCIFDRVKARRVAWIPMRRVKDVVFEGKAGGTTTVKAEAKKPRAKKAA